MPTALIRVLGSQSGQDDIEDLESATEELVDVLRDLGDLDVGFVRPGAAEGKRDANFLWLAVPLIAASRAIVLALIDNLGKWAAENRRVVRVKIGDAQLDVEGGSARTQTETVSRFLDALGHPALSPGDDAEAVDSE